MKASICISSYGHAPMLRRTLRSIVAQNPPFKFEVIVVDDGNPDDQTRDVCDEFCATCIRHDRLPGYTNPARARNLAYRAAKGAIIIAQSDEVLHGSPDAIERLVTELEQGEFLISTVLALKEDGDVEPEINAGYYTGPRRPRPYFFLGSVRRSDVYAIGGNDEEFIQPCYDDDWFADCLMWGLCLKPRYVDVFGFHQWHTRPSGLVKASLASLAIYDRKRLAAKAGKAPWCSSGGPWR